MTSSNVLVNDTVRITVKFIHIDSTTGNPIEVEPTTVVVVIKNGDNVTIINASAVELTGSTWYYDFTPTTPDTYSVQFTGTVPTVGNITVQQKLYVSSLTEDYKPTVLLNADETITFAGEIAPLYLDPESLLPYFPDASLLEIAEIVYTYSLEVKDLFGLRDDEDGSGLKFNVLEYIKAASACDLTRTYGFGGDDEVSLRLGDLSITNRNLPRLNVSRDNASTWCQIAAALRKEMLAVKSRAVVMQPKGLPIDYKAAQLDKTVYPSDKDIYGQGQESLESIDPMPSRKLRRHD